MLILSVENCEPKDCGDIGCGCDWGCVAAGDFFWEFDIVIRRESGDCGYDGVAGGVKECGSESVAVCRCGVRERRCDLIRREEMRMSIESV